MSGTSNPVELILEVNNLNTAYGEIEVLRDVSFTLDTGKIVAIFGPNGHGKTTLLKTIAGLHAPKSGNIFSNGKQINGWPSDKIVENRIALIPEKRHLFPEMTVMNNLVMGAYNRLARKVIKANLELVFSLFPRLAERINQAAYTLSGGESRMLAIGRGLMSNASLLLVDEPSIGLSPFMKDVVFEAMQTIQKSINISILLVEQEVNYPLQIAHKIYVLRKGHIVLEQSGDEINKVEIEKHYF